MKLRVLVGAILALGIAAAAQAQYTPNFSMTSIQWEDETTFWMSGARIDGLGLTRNDEAYLKYTFSKPDGSFLLSDAKVFLNAGVVYSQGGSTMTSIDAVPRQPEFVVNGNSYTAGPISRSGTATAASPFVATMSLKVGQVMYWLVEEPSENYTYEFINSNGRVLLRFDGVQYSGILSSSYRVTSDGVYSLRINPRDANQLTFKLKLMNANESTVQEVRNGSYISTSFGSDARSYIKAKVRLNAGERITLQNSSNPNVSSAIVDSYSRLQIDSTGPISFLASRTDDYYIFVYYRGIGPGGYNSSSVSIVRSAERAIDSAGAGRGAPMDLGAMALPLSVSRSIEKSR